jgi:hypothetical protein
VDLFKFYLDVFEIDPYLLVPPFRSSVDQVYHEMAPIGHYNLEEATSMFFSASFQVISPSPKNKTQRRTHTLESKKKFKR